MPPTESPDKRSSAKTSTTRAKSLANRPSTKEKLKYPIRTIADLRESEERKERKAGSRRRINRGSIEEEAPTPSSSSSDEASKMPSTFAEKHGKGKSIEHHTPHLLSDEGRAKAEAKKAAKVSAKAGDQGKTKTNDDTTEAPKRGRPKKSEPLTSEAPRRRSPRKKIIDDCPSPELRLDPFPPQKPPMLVSNKPAVTNKYGEKVVARPDPEVWLQQAINFLSDEGPENCKDFHVQFRIMEDEFRSRRPFPNAANREEIDDLCERLDSMIRVHHARIEEGGEEWFLRNTFPGMLAAKLAEGDVRQGDREWKRLNEGIHFGAPKYPKMQIMLKERAMARATIEAEMRNKQSEVVVDSADVRDKDKGRAVGAEDEGEEEDDDEDDNSASWEADTLPRPEVWHRKSAALFPFGEIPHMETVLSRQIHADLARGARDNAKARQTGFFAPLIRAGINFIYSTTQSSNLRENETASPWVLPEVKAEDLADAEETYGIPGTEKLKKRRYATRSLSPNKKTRTE